MLRSLLTKLKDPSSFSFPYLIRNVSIDHALCDLGSSVSLMSLSLCEKLDLVEMKPTTISLWVVDHFMKYPGGVLEDVSIKVGDLYVPVDIMILEIEEDTHTPIILGKSF